MQSNKTISRFLDSTTSQVLLTDVLVLHPFVCSLASFLDKNEFGVYNAVLFVLDGARMDDETMRQAACELLRSSH